MRCPTGKAIETRLGKWIICLVRPKQSPLETRLMLVLLRSSES